MADTKKARVPAETFIQAYQTSTSNAQVSEKTGLTIAGVSARAKSLRKHDVDLKKFVRTPGAAVAGRAPVDYNALKAYAASFLPQA